MMSTSAFPETQPGPVTTPETTEFRPLVRWSVPAAPTLDQGSGLQPIAAPVLGRALMLPLSDANVVGLSEACPRIVNAFASLLTSSTWNWTYARVTVAPCGTRTPVNRRPTIWFDPSYTSSRSAPPPATLAADA